MSARRADDTLAPFLVAALIRASSLHVGAAAAAAALRKDLVESGPLRPEHFDEAMPSRG